MCFGQAADPELMNLIKIEVAELRESVNMRKDDVDNVQVSYVQFIISGLGRSLSGRGVGEGTYSYIRVHN